MFLRPFPSSYEDLMKSVSNFLSNAVNKPIIKLINKDPRKHNLHSLAEVFKHPEDVKFGFRNCDISLFPAYLYKRIIKG